MIDLGIVYPEGHFLLLFYLSHIKQSGLALKRRHFMAGKPFA
jgi:hypothetical protein